MQEERIFWSEEQQAGIVMIYSVLPNGVRSPEDYVLRDEELDEDVMHFPARSEWEAGTYWRGYCKGKEMSE